MSKKKTALITGTNRGLGLEISRQLAKAGYHVIMTARNVEAGAERVAELRKMDLDVEFLPLDVTNETSIDRVVQYVRDNVATLDIIVNNAGVALEGREGDNVSILKVPTQMVRDTLEINTLGPMRMIQKLSPFMRGGGSIVNVSSGLGQLKDMEGYFAAYQISKTALNAVTKIAASELKDAGIRVNSVCPGWVRTDMGGPEADRSLEEGANGIVWLATQGENGPTGKFFRDKEELAW